MTRTQRIGNPFVDYLSRFTTANAVHEGVFDEHNVGDDNPYAREFHLSTRISEFIKAKFSEDTPPSIILTGNAGDGKTYLCRQVIETFTGERINRWEKQSDITVSRNGIALRIIKDLSDFTEESGREIIRDLEAQVAKDSPDMVFLVAANEGRLRAVLIDPAMEKLRRHIEEQLKEGPTAGDLELRDRLKIINLNKVTTSCFVQQALEFLTRLDYWNVCENCVASDSCPIRFNRNRLSEEYTRGRIELLYKLLEYLGIHVTLRDMLIHLAYTLIGDLDCRKVIETARQPGQELFQYAYYENALAEHAPEELQKKLTVVRHLRRFGIGEYSFFDLDDFIINGGLYTEAEGHEEYDHLFVPAVDLKGEHFAQRRKAYLLGRVATVDENRLDGQDEFLTWLPHCRRKLFFEWRRVEVVNRLIPFIAFTDYLELLGGNRAALDQAKELVVLGLNRAFTGLFLPPSEIHYLYTTSQYAHGVEQPIPVVKIKIPTMSIELLPDHESPSIAEVMDVDARFLTMRFPDPRSLAESIIHRLNLLQFEYLVRLARGGTDNILSEECGLFIRDLKDQLLTRFGSSMETSEKIEFFAAEDNRYVLKALYIDQEGKLR